MRHGMTTMAAGAFLPGLAGGAMAGQRVDLRQAAGPAQADSRSWRGAVDAEMPAEKRRGMVEEWRAAAKEKGGAGSGMPGGDRVGAPNSRPWWVRGTGGIGASESGEAA